jgi:hypothetical protein
LAGGQCYDSSKNLALNIGDKLAILTCDNTAFNAEDIKNDHDTGDY